VNKLIGEFERIANGMAMLGERPPRSVDEGVAVGERLSALLVSEHLKAEGTPAAAVNARDLVVTDAVFGNASPLMEATREKARAKPAADVCAKGHAAGDHGFQRRHGDGRPTTLGRGGSDFSCVQSSQPRWMLRNCGSGPTWTAS